MLSKFGATWVILPTSRNWESVEPVGCRTCDQLSRPQAGPQADPSIVEVASFDSEVGPPFIKYHYIDN